MRKGPTERFWEKVDKSAGPEGCWLWTGSRTSRGYGQFQDAGFRDYVHRLSYEAAIGGPVPEGMYVDHKCHVTLCVNPLHLHAVTNAENGQNRRGAAANSMSGVRGVHRQGDRWRVRVKVDGFNHSGGLFDNLEDAAHAASELRARLMPNSLADKKVSA